MEVTRTNFDDVLPQIKDAIDNCTYLCFDTELTGVDLGKDVRFGILDDPQTRYDKTRTVANAFYVIQYGLATFTWDEANCQYETKVFTFYTFQRAFEGRWPDMRFTCQSISIEFLANHKMDFNKVFYDGVSFLTREQESFMRTKIESMNLDREQIPLRENQEFIDEMCQQIDEWLQKGEESELWLAAVNPFQRRLQYQELEKRYPQGILWEARNNENRRKCLVITRATVEQRRDRQREAKNARLATLLAAIGFRNIIDHIAASKKPVVGHNMLLDLCIAYRQFVNPLPSDLAEFKQAIIEEMPIVYDTKYLTSVDEVKADFQNTALSEVFERVQAEPFKDAVTFAFADGHELQAEEAHNAGYDAYMTGVCFGHLAKTISGENSGPSTITSPALQNYCNRLYLMRTDIPYLLLNGDDPEPDRSGTFYLYGFPAAWKTSDILEAFATFGNVQVRWVDDVSCFVIVHDDQAGKVLDYFGESVSNVHIMLYADYVKERNLNKTNGDSVNESESARKRPRTQD